MHVYGVNCKLMYIPACCKHRFYSPGSIPTVYHSEIEVFSENSLCFMSVLGGGIHLSYELSEPFNPSNVLGESQPFQQFLLPHCYDVRPFGYDGCYKYSIVPGGEDYLGALYTMQRQLQSVNVMLNFFTPCAAHHCTVLTICTNMQILCALGLDRRLLWAVRVWNVLHSDKLYSNFARYLCSTVS